MSEEQLPEKKKKYARRQKNTLPNIGATIYDHYKASNMSHQDLEKLTGISSSLIYKMRTRDTFVQTVFSVCVGMKRNFFADIQEHLYTKLPELRLQDPTYKRMIKLEKEVKMISEENTNLKDLMKVKDQLIGVLTAKK